MDDEGAIVERAKAGDREALHALYIHNVRDVARFVSRRVPRSDVEDVVADTFARAFGRLDRFEWRGVPLRAWLLRLAHHEIVARSRKRSSTEVVTAEPRPTDTDGHEEAIVERHAWHTDVRRALDALPASQRNAIELRFLDELPAADVGLVMDMSEQAVRALTYRAMRTLRAALEPSG